MDYGQGQLLLLLLLAMTAALQSWQKLRQSTMQLGYLIMRHLSGGDPEQAMLLRQLQYVSRLIWRLVISALSQGGIQAWGMHMMLVACFHQGQGRRPSN